MDEAYQADVQDSLYGEGGGKGGGGSARTPREAPNTLRSTSKARIIDALCEGPIVGLADGMKSIFLDDTPLQDEGGDYNFQGVTVHTRDGDPDQAHIAGFPAVETANDVSVEVLADTPVVRTVGNLDADAVRVTVQLPTLTFQDKENVDLLGTFVDIAIDVRPDGGSWVQRKTDTIQGKTTSPYQRTYRIDLNGSGPWDVRVRRLTADSDSATLRNQTYWATYTEVIDAKLQYPDTALVGLEVDAAQFGNQIPKRSYDVKGLIVRVPSNYDPATRTYSGLWDGSYKLAWSDNPAWCFLDLATSQRYGAGLESVDKWGLYQIAQYCDELVPNGYGEQEPRFTFNTVLSSREEAITALNTLASAFRGMTYWGANTVMPVADMPADPVKLVTPANVIDGEFEYSGSALKARHSVALVSWNDPDDNFRLQVEVVEDADAIQQLGWKQLDVTAVACTSRGQAHRLGKWMLASERAETETVTYSAGVDHADVRPGDLIALSDPTTAGARLGGRIVTTGLQTLELDQVPESARGDDWYFDALLPSGGIERREVATFSGNTVTLVDPLSAEPIRGAIWLLSSQSVEPRQFRVLSVTEQESGVYQISALEHDPTKYGRIELGLDLAEPDYSLIPTGPVVAPFNISVESFRYIAGGTEHQGLTISWTPSDDARVTNYIAEVQGPNDVKWRVAHSGPGTSFDILDAASGQWMVRVRGVTGTGTLSPWVALTTNVAGLLLPIPPDSINIEVGTFTVTLIPNGGRPGQQWEFWRATTALDESVIESNAIRRAVASSLTDTELTPATTYYYYVRGINAYGVSDWYPVQATTENDPSKIMQVISGQIKQTDLFSDLSQNIDGLNSSYVLNITGGGRVAGFGTAYDEDQDVFDFGVLADRFYIAQPGDGAQEVIPFIFTDGALYLKEALIQSLTFTKLRASDGSLIFQNGKLQAEYIAVDQLNVDWAQIKNASISNAQIQDGAITSAKIQNAAITSAQIADAQVGSLQIGENAVTVPAASSSIGKRYFYVTNINNSVSLHSATLDAEGGSIMVTVSAIVYADAGAGSAVYVTLKEDGSTVFRKQIVENFETNSNSATKPFSATVIRSPGSGSHTYSLEMTAFNYGNGETWAELSSLSCLGVKR
jgi:predicted phage tail protein